MCNAPYGKRLLLKVLYFDFNTILYKEKSDSVWNLIVSPLESAISYKFLMFQKIPYRERLLMVLFFCLDAATTIHLRKQYVALNCK